MKERVSAVVMPALPWIAPRDPYPLLRATINLLDEDDLQSVARADYGNDSGEHFARLADIVRLCELPTPLKWHPREVLELTRWSEASAEDPDIVARIHKQRAFACTVLLVSYGDPNNVDASYGSNQTLIKLLDSLEMLGTEVEDDALSLLSWLIPRLPDHEAGEVPFFGLAMLWLALDRSTRQDDVALLSLCEWIISAEEVVRRRQSTGGRLAGSWLLSGSGYDTHLDAWRRLGRRLVDRLDRRHGPEVKEAVHLIGAMLT